jgi:TPR repeat protein
LQLGQVPEMKGIPKMALALSFYKKAAEKECKEAYYKIGYFYQYGIEIEKNLQLAIRKYEEGAACVS